MVYLGVIFYLVNSSVVLFKFIQEIDLALACIMLNPQSILLKTGHNQLIRIHTVFSLYLLKIILKQVESCKLIGYICIYPAWYKLIPKEP